MSEPAMTPQEVSQIFAQMVMMQAQNALYLLGRIPDGSGRPIPPQLPEAKMLIDQLEALQIKTKGNLVAQEEKLLAKVLTEIRLAFVEASGGTPASMMPGHHSAAYGAGDPYADMGDEPLPEEGAAENEPPPFLAAQPEPAPAPKPKAAPTPEAPAAPKEPEKEKKFFKSYG